MQVLNATPTARQTSTGLLLIRLILGTIFIAHGAQKVFTYGMGAIGGSFGELGIPLAGVLGPVVSLVELLGGVALVLGLFTRAAGVGVGATMLGAIWFAHLSSGFFAPAGYEYPLMLLAAAAAMTVMGGGAWSLDAVVSRRLAAGTEARAATPSHAGEQSRLRSAVA